MHPKLTIVNLPVTGEFRPTKRAADDRGELHLIEDGASFGHLACFTLRPGPGRFRGGHSHRVRSEHLYVVSGSFEIECADLDTGERFALRLAPGDKAVIRPGLAHRLRALGEAGAGEATAVEYYEGAYDRDDDIPYAFDG
ncbi:WxcM-like domain-containing protein [Desulfovibrio sp. X2]|nr:WxcM-like domain-containing protein [Desulfovibrio sp. X2]